MKQTLIEAAKTIIREGLELAVFTMQLLPKCQPLIILNSMAEIAADTIENRNKSRQEML